jgi:hypothetical protein
MQAENIGGGEMAKEISHLAAIGVESVSAA